MEVRRTGPVLVLGASLLVAGACAAGEQPRATEERSHYGEAVALGNGTARTYVTLRDGVPVELGVAISESALEGLPELHEHGPPAFEHVLRLPAEAGVLPYDHVTVDWVPAGHEPPGIYDVPHFDIHFYKISPERRAQIDPTHPEYAAKAGHAPPAEYVPAGFIMPAPEAVPMMGTHWIAADAPELRGEPFTATFIFGSWDGELIFAEPMIAKSFLESRPNFTAPVAVAERHGWSGYHPTSYSVRYDESAGEFRIALSGFTAHD